ncbi:MAG: glycosyltransferase [Rhodospirillales bacterium]|nr:glycosyltransferase [Rhodospirillales bacterium]
MRTIQVMAGAERGGAEAFFQRLVPALARAGLEVRAIVRDAGARAAELESEGVGTVRLPFGGPLDLSTRWRLRREIRAFKPDVVMTWMNRATMLCPSGDFVHVGRLGGYYDLKYYRACDHLVANTEDIVAHLVEQGFDADRVHYLPNFADEAPAPPVARRTLYTPETTPLLLGLGRLHRNKAFDVLIEAMGRLPDAYLWLAGDGPERAFLEALAERTSVKPRVRFLGWRDDVPALLAACDALVCPSRHEPLGNVVLEAWAQRVPVIAAASQGPGMLITDGASGLLVPVDDAIELARAARAVFRDPLLTERLIAGGRAAFEASYTEAKVVARYRRFFEMVAGSRDGPR